MLGGLRVCGYLFALGMALGACRSVVVPALPAPSLQAQAAMDRASLLLREGSDTPGVRETLQEAVRLAPDWEVPRRRLDDLQRQDLLGPRALRAHWEALERGEQPGLHSYLSGRLNSQHSAEWFQEAYRVQPRNPWGLHGLAFVAAGQGRFARATELQIEALGLARETEERKLMALALARYQRAAGDHVAAARTLTELWSGTESGPRRDGIEVALLAAELSLDDKDARRRARVRATRLLRSGDLSPAELGTLVELGLVNSEVIRAWLLLRPSTGKAGVWSRELSLQLLELEDAGAVGVRTLRDSSGRSIRARTVELFARGQALDAWRLWRGSLPSFMGGLSSKRAELAHVEHAVHQYNQNKTRLEPAVKLAGALLRAGWFEEAQAFIRTLPGGMEVDMALRLEAQATLGQQTMRALAKLMTDLDRERAFLAPSDPVDEQPSAGRQIESLNDLLQAVGQVLWGAGPYYYWDLTRTELEESLVSSPRLRFGPFAQVVHPGPGVAAWDAEKNLGEVGAPVPGLAQWLGRLGRVGIFGSAMGIGAPDASVLRLVYSEGIEGEHLGVPFHGTRLWCDGTDVGALNVRLGASVAGAALHEGYFLDLHEVRVAHARWGRLAQRFDAGGSQERLADLLEILSDPGLPVESPALFHQDSAPVVLADPDQVVAPMDSWLLTDALLGQADRNRLAWMGERAQDNGGAPGDLRPPSFEEEVLLTAIHEEGHLCERTRFLPLSQHWPAALAFLAAQNFSSMGVQQRFEYRAQLVALCKVEDPRLVLVEILDMAESGGSGLPHGKAYAQLLKDLVHELGSGLRQSAPWLRGLEMDEQHRLVFQLHRLPVEALRATALRLAAREGLVGRE